MSKLNSRIQLTANKIKGKIAEEIAKQDYLDHGFQIQKTGIGSDFIAIKNNGDTIYKEYVDVKSGNAKLTKKQRQTKSLLKKENISYSIYRVTNKHLEFQIENNFQLQQYCQDMGYDVSQFTGIFVIQDPVSCPNCELSASGLHDILTDFGF